MISSVMPKILRTLTAISLALFFLHLYVLWGLWHMAGDPLPLIAALFWAGPIAGLTAFCVSLIAPRQKAVLIGNSIVLLLYAGFWLPQLVSLS